jgi:hypothetical protein
LLSTRTPRYMARSLSFLLRGILSYTICILSGIAIIAHLFSVSPATSSSLQNTAHSSSHRRRPFDSAAAAANTSSSSSSSVFDDPFLSPSFASSSSSLFSRNDGADICLDLEMLRHSDLKATRVVRLGQAPSTTITREQQPPVGRGRKGLKDRIEMLRKGKASLQSLPSATIDMDKGKGKEGTGVEYVEVERQADLRLYLDGRCSRTREWFETAFCLEKVLLFSFILSFYVTKSSLLECGNRWTKTGGRETDSSSLSAIALGPVRLPVKFP